jgi:glycosyltransferase involved in cell wall biosynthesis
MNLADNNLFAPASNSFARESQNGHFNILYHGTLAHRYGIDFLLRAVEIALREALNIKLTVHGRGDYLEVLRQLSDELKLGDHIKFSDQYLPIEQLPALISDANVGVVPYRRDVFTDGILPTKLMEYAAMGVPAIVARTPVIASYFDETMVEFFPAENVEELAKCIVSLYRDRQRLNELATNIQKFNSNYNWPKQKKGYIALVRELSN